MEGLRVVTILPVVLYFLLVPLYDCYTSVSGRSADVDVWCVISDSVSLRVAWPVLIFAPVVLGHTLSKPEALIMATFALVLAVVTFVFVERPIRRNQTLVRRSTLGLAFGGALIAASLAAVALSGPALASLHAGPAVAAPSTGARKQLTAQRLAADLRAGVATRRVPSNLTPSLTAAAADDPQAGQGCLLGFSGVKSPGCAFGDRSSRTTVILYGDSHAAQWFPAMESISRQQRWRLVVLTKSGCPPAEVKVRWLGGAYPNCLTWRRNTERQIAALHPALLVVASSYYLITRRLPGVPTGYGSLWQDGTEAAFRRLHAISPQVIWIAATPTLHQPAPDCVSAHLSDVRPCTVSRKQAYPWPKVKAGELALAAKNHIATIDPASWMCTRTRCPVIVGNILLYRDDQHMVPEWSRFIAPVVKTAILKRAPTLNTSGSRA